MDPEKEITNLSMTSDTELGLLIENFNDMSKRIHDTQSELKQNIQELESANQEIRDTQAKLVHTAKMASLGQLVAGVAHELNNPIGFIYSNMDHLRDYSQKLKKLIEVAEKEPKALSKLKKEIEYDYLIEDLPKLISSCEDGARRTRDIVLGLKNFSRLGEAESKSINIHDNIDDTLKLLTGELKNRIEVHKAYGDLPKIQCRPSQMNQVFMNILSNAAQAISDKGDIYITTEKLDESFVEIAIKDTGKGMPASSLEKIFDPFFTTKSLGKGTGLGLSISYGIVQEHGGDLFVESELGQGTTFTIRLPIK